MLSPREPLARLLTCGSAILVAGIQAKAGRVVMTVDCTNLLNLRHIEDKDNAWLTRFPAKGEVFVRLDCR